MPRRGPPPDSTAVRFRAATLRDLDLLVEHRLAMWREIREYPASVLSRHAKEYRRWILPLLRRREVVGVVAVGSGGAPVGSGLLWYEPGQPRPGNSRLKKPYVLSMYTARSHRGRGVASRIVERFLALAAAKGFPFVTLHASPQGRPVYRSLGFERTWEMRRWVDDRARRAWARPPRRRPARSPRR